ncbi:hypothetical protein [Kaistia sp. MMO-174]|uniref:hypothetical protein n=1 Tax=Kaistia sp. MMO-174 TaxID=3081256 RepID=UPI001AC9DA96|nr:hypothetical protein [Hyphomicrobiales bacterium]MBN9059490.1 hypothetical protein [Hyphomicrobiales bacterium]
MPDEKTARKDAPNQEAPKKTVPMPPEGPHARPDLTDYDKTPGTGSLPDPDTKGVDIGPG